MKKYLTALVLVAMIVPQVALASWWNPFSWGIFHKTDTKTQILETRFKEFESKASTTASVKEKTDTEITIKKVVSTSTKSVQKEKPGVLAPTQTTQVEKQVITASTQNQNTSAQALEDKRVIMNKIATAYATYKTSLDYSDRMVALMDERISKLNSAINNNISGVGRVSNADFIYAIESLNKYYNFDIEMAKIYKDLLNGYKQSGTTMIDAISNDSIKLAQATNFSALDFQKWNSDFDDVLKKADSHFSGVKSGVSKWMDYNEKQSVVYKQWSEVLGIIIKSMSATPNNSNPTTDYISNQPVSPIVIPPKIQTCYFTTYPGPFGATGKMECY